MTTQTHKWLSEQPTDEMLNDAGNAAWIEGMYIDEDILIALYKAMWQAASITEPDHYYDGLPVYAEQANIPEVEQEPVAWRYEGEPYFDGNAFIKTYRLTEVKEVAEFNSGTLKKPTPLYTHPQQKRKPLSEGKLYQMFSKTNIAVNSGDFVEIARLIEKAYGIEESSK
jgi:hypothetical protein